MRRQTHNCFGGFGWWHHRTAAALSLEEIPTELLRRIWGWSAAGGLLLRSRGSPAGRLRAAYPLLPTGNGECTHFCCFFAVGNVRPGVLLEDVEKRKTSSSEVRSVPFVQLCLFAFFFLPPKKNCCGDQRCSTAALLLLLLLLLLLRPKIFF